MFQLVANDHTLGTEMFALGWKTAGNQSNHKNFDPSLLLKKLWLTFMGMKKKKISKWPTQKNWDFQNCKFSKKNRERALMWLNLYGCETVRCYWILQRSFSVCFPPLIVIVRQEEIVNLWQFILQCTETVSLISYIFNTIVN